MEKIAIYKNGNIWCSIPYRNKMPKLPENGKKRGVYITIFWKHYKISITIKTLW